MMENFDYKINIIENYYNLDTEKIISDEIVKNSDFYLPILNNGIISPSNKSMHFLIPLLLAKKYLETKNIYVYNNIYQSFINNINATGRFFEALSTENFTIDEKTLVISFGEDTQHFGQIFAMGLQCVDYLDLDNKTNIDNIEQIYNYKKIIFYVNELTPNNKIFKIVKNNFSFNNERDINIACVLNYTKNIQINIISLIDLDLDLKFNKENNIVIYKCNFPFYQNNVINKAIDNNAKQNDNLIETIMTIMSSQDFNMIGNKIKILFLCDDSYSYIPMLISEFMSGFDTYDIYFSKTTKIDIDIEDKLIINNINLEYAYNIKKDKYNFMFYITKKDIQYDSCEIKQLSKLKNIENINIIKEI